MHYSLKRQPQRDLRMGVLMQLQQKLWRKHILSSMQWIGIESCHCLVGKAR